MAEQEIKDRIRDCRKLLIGLGEVWNTDRNDQEKKADMLKAYQALYELVKDKDYFIITMATDALIFDSPLGSREERITAPQEDEDAEETVACAEQSLTPEIMEKMNQLFPKKEKRPQDTRFERITAPCGNVTWRQCSRSCTKDIWELGEVPDEICPHCGAPLTGNTVDADQYIEEGYLPQWQKYKHWISGTFQKDTLILELGVGFQRPELIRFAFEKTAFFHQKSYFCRVNQTFPQVTAELEARAEGIRRDPREWVEELAAV